MKHKRIFKAWKHILMGRYPVLALEITNKCPLSCPGCYAFRPDHLDGNPLSSVADLRGDALVSGVLELVDRKRPVGMFIVGGEPLLRVRELSILLPEISRRGVEVEVVTSGVVPIPAAWKDIDGLGLSISIDGLPEEHDRRRKPATYSRILENIEGQKVVIHCTVTGPMMERENSLALFVDFWSKRLEVETIRMSLYTPQIGETSTEILSPLLRQKVISELDRLRAQYPKLRVTPEMIEAYATPPSKPDDCIFAQVTECLAPDLTTQVVPCQLGGQPNCSECGCMAAVGLHAVGLHPLPGGLQVADVFRSSLRLGNAVRSILHRGADRHRPAGPTRKPFQEESPVLD